MPPPSSSTRGSALSDAIVNELKQLIYTGEFKPGERLNEAALALRMGTSRGPIREAIKVLAGLGIVNAVTNRGVYVRQLSLREMLEIYEMRALVFGYAAERACEHLTEEHKKQFEALLAAMDAACDAEDGTLYYELNLQFHALILTLSNNRRAYQAYDDYVKELHLVRRKYFNAPGNMRRSNIEHRAIFDAIAAANRSRARAAAERHVLAGRARLLSNFEEPQPGA
ncbi:transcriptional regulator, GntR family [Variovorax paradoxus B4]|jgi:DNA-binding GntR family transcriptional regulator|uniref:HTH-type transcriptional regulator LutR n=2 Tax=Variovorax paradoxus TaxID=34073 RepID=A0A0H2LSY2_VARPD|nr:FCD domain-containing protein [Variovorax paradoxus]AGU52612.1 transcriptional regulator, GntR family [Variovorax paradoxus B4]KLN53378.1 HTH-type transcriptional regulator LutR [Variovorax paradoxus]